MSANKSSATVLERIRIPKPAYFAGSNVLVHPSKREVPVAKSLKDMSPEELSALGIEPGKLLMPTFGSPNPKKEKQVREPKVKVQKEKTEPKVDIPADPFMGVKFTEAHILSNEDFIRYTRKYTIHDKGIKAIFFANGGAAYLGCDTLQTAFEAMRRNILAKIAGLTAASMPYKRVNQLEGEHHVFNEKAYEQSMLIRARAFELARIRSENSKWLNTPILKRKLGT